MENYLQRLSCVEYLLSSLQHYFSFQMHTWLVHACIHRLESAHQLVVGVGGENLGSFHQYHDVELDERSEYTTSGLDLDRLEGTAREEILAEPST